jgi:hypothetical protein
MSNLLCNKKNLISILYQYFHSYFEIYPLPTKTTDCVTRISLIKVVNWCSII